MTVQEYAIAESLARVGIAIAPHAQPERGWGFSIENDKIIRGWDGPYASAAEAADAAMAWLLEYARKGLLCHHTHPVPVEDDPMAPWLRAFEGGIELPE